MNITLLAVTKTPATTAKGNGYELLDIAFKNNAYGGKVEGKKITPFGANKPAYDTLANAAPGTTFDITVVKENGFNNWTAATPAEAGAPSVQAAPAATYSAPRPAGAAAPAAANSRGFETPEERAAKQVYIVRQSSISAAVSALSVGSKSAPAAESVISYAKQLESFVFGRDVKPMADDFSDLDSDVPL